MAPRILYLHGLRAKPGDHKHKLLQTLYGEMVTAPDLKTRQFSSIAFLLFALQVLSFFSVLLMAFRRLPGWAAAVSAVILVVGGLSLSMLIIRGLTAMCVARAVRIATASYDTQQPNLIVSDGFGSVIARRISRPKPAVLMFSPMLEKYAKWSGDRSHRRLDSYPYLYLVDEVVASADTYRTLERADPDRCKLDLLEFNSTQKQISEAELKTYVEDSLEGGKRGAQQVAEIDPHAAIPVDAF